MYGVDKYGKVYVFDIISEYSNEIIAKITRYTYLTLICFTILIMPKAINLIFPEDLTFRLRPRRNVCYLWYGLAIKIVSKINHTSTKHNKF